MGAAHVSGTALLSLRKYLESVQRVGAFEQLREKLPADHRAALQGIILPMSWYSEEAYIALLENAQSCFGPSNFCEQFGAAAADLELSTVHKFILRFTSPTWLLTRGTRVWRSYHDSGAWSIEGGPRSVRGTLRDFGVVNPHFCNLLVGWLRRCGQLTGAQSMRIEHSSCRSNDADSCIFNGTW